MPSELKPGFSGHDNDDDGEVAQVQYSTAACMQSWQLQLAAYALKLCNACLRACAHIIL